SFSSCPPYKNFRRIAGGRCTRRNGRVNSVSLVDCKLILCRLICGDTGPSVRASRSRSGSGGFELLLFVRESGTPFELRRAAQPHRSIKPSIRHSGDTPSTHASGVDAVGNHLQPFMPRVISSAALWKAEQPWLSPARPLAIRIVDVRVLDRL